MRARVQGARVQVAESPGSAPCALEKDVIERQTCTRGFQASGNWECHYLHLLSTAELSDSAGLAHLMRWQPSFVPRFFPGDHFFFLVVDEDFPLNSW